MTRRVRHLLLAGAALAAAALGVSPWIRPAADAGTAEPGADPLVALEERPRPNRPLPGDPAAGARLYRVHCASCHGFGGEGDGTAAVHLWPRPRNHTDASYMNARTDADLFTAIEYGGKAVARSGLMPSFEDRFDALEVWALVAHVRTLAAVPPAGAPAHARVRDLETILSVERARAAAAESGAPLEHRVVAHVLEDAAGATRGYVMYPAPRIGGARVLLALAFDVEGAFVAAESHRRLRVKGLPPDAVDRWLEARMHGPLDGAPGVEEDLRRAVAAARALLRQAVTQHWRDVAEADDLLHRPPGDPGTRLYLANCARCHGATGRVIGPGVVAGPFKPRNFADGARMNSLSDEYIRSVITQGGLHWNLSGSMPSFQSLSPEDVAALVEHVRSFAIPPPDRPCPCSAAAGACSMVDVAGHCRCRGAHATEGPCPHRKS